MLRILYKLVMKMVKKHRVMEVDAELIPQEAVDDSNVKYLLVSKNNRVNETVNCSIACNDGYAFICPTGEDTANENKPQCINPTPEENYYGDNLQDVINNIKSADAMVYLDSLNNLVSVSQATPPIISPNLCLYQIHLLILIMIYLILHLVVMDL